VLAIDGLLSPNMAIARNSVKAVKLDNVSRPDKGRPGIPLGIRMRIVIPGRAPETPFGDNARGRMGLLHCGRARLLRPCLEPSQQCGSAGIAQPDPDDHGTIDETALRRGKSSSLVMITGAQPTRQSGRKLFVDQEARQATVRTG